MMNTSSAEDCEQVSQIADLLVESEVPFGDVHLCLSAEHLTFLVQVLGECLVNDYLGGDDQELSALADALDRYACIYFPIIRFRSLLASLLFHYYHLLTTEF